jgi:hypothetical protein
MNLGGAALVLALAGAGVFAASRVCVRWMYRAANASSWLAATSIVVAACAVLFVVAVLPLFALVLLASGTAWAEAPFWFIVEAAWLLSVAPGLWHLSRHARTIKAALETRWGP